MSKSVFVVSEWLPKPGCEKALWEAFQLLVAQTKTEPGCISARITRQIEHPGSPGKSKFTMVAMQEYSDVTGFDFHCSQDYVAAFFEACVANAETALVEDWTCRLFSEEGA